MTSLGVLLVVAAGLSILVWILNQTRLGRLYVGYGVIFVGAIVVVVLLAAVPALRRLVLDGVQAVFPGAGLTTVVVAVIALLLVYVFIQLTVIANRLSTVVQEVALQQATGRRSQDAREEAARMRRAPRA